MKFLHLIQVALLVIIVVISCGWEQRDVVETPDLETETPDIYDNESSYRDYMPVTKSRGYNAVDMLFKEAREKDKDLDQLMDDMDNIGDVRNEVYEPMSKYMKRNALYWTHANGYANAIRDTSKQEKILAFLQELEKEYENEISDISDMQSRIKVKESMLQDQRYIMQLVVSSKMIRAYQRNEIPDKEVFEELDGKYDDLLERTEVYTEY